MSLYYVTHVIFLYKFSRRRWSRALRRWIRRKLGPRVTQGHRKCHGSIGYLCLSDR